MRLVLASSSPRRRRLMEEAGMEFNVAEPFAEELHEGKVEKLIIENAVRKVNSVEARDGDIIIGCDTVVVCNGETLGKPADIDDARRMLELQIKYPQKVYTGIAVRDAGRRRTFHGFEISTVVMEGGIESVEEQLSTEEWKGKAGAYGIQDRSPLKARVISGEEDNVVGLPMTLLRRLLSLVGFEYPNRTPA